MSKLQIEVTLSSTESKYIALSTALYDVIPIMSLVEGIAQNLSFKTTVPTIHCTLFEDNNGALELANTHKLYKLKNYFENLGHNIMKQK